MAEEKVNYIGDNIYIHTLTCGEPCWEGVEPVGIIVRGRPGVSKAEVNCKYVLSVRLTGNNRNSIDRLRGLGWPSGVDCSICISRFQNVTSASSMSDLLGQKGEIPALLEVRCVKAYFA